MKTYRSFTAHAVLVAALLLLAVLSSIHAAESPQPGTAIAIVYDTSGSMRDSVPNAGGSMEPKYVIASRAFKEIITKIDAYAKDHKVEAGIICFRSGGASVAVPFGAWNKDAFNTWLTKFRDPDGGTPLGEALTAACLEVGKSGLKHKHVVVLTDGEANGRVEPAAAIKDARKKAGAASPQIHIVAFDVNAGVFNPVKKAGANILPANNAKALASGLQTLFAEKILLENEE